MEPYDPTFNYFLEMLEFAGKRPNFNPVCFGETKYANQILSIHRSMEVNPFIKMTPDDYNKFWWKWLTSDTLQEQRIGNELKTTTKQILVGDPLQDNWIFVTLNFNDTEPITGAKMLHFAQQICKKDWVENATFVLEKHRCQGVHHHIHLLIDLNIPQRKGKTIELIYKIGGLKKYCAGKQYVDVKCAKDALRAPRDVYENYVSGNKKEEKMFFVEKDRQWRKANNLQDLYIYKKTT